MVANPVTSPSAGVLAIRSSSERRLRCAASANAPYSTKLPASTRSAMFSRAVRRFWLCHLATASERPSSRVRRCRSRISSRSARGASGSCSTPDGSTPAAPLNASTGSPALTVCPADTRAYTAPAPAGAASTCLHLHRLQHDGIGPHVDDGAGHRCAQHLFTRCHRSAGPHCTWVRSRSLRSLPLAVRGSASGTTVMYCGTL